MTVESEGRQKKTRESGVFNIEGRFHLYVCMFYGFCVFCLDEVGLQPLVLWYTKNSFTSLHGKCSVIHGSNAGNA